MDDLTRAFHDSALIGIVRQFNDALNNGDVDGMMRCMTEDCVFENTYPPPDGTRYEGQAAVRAFWEDFFRGSMRATIEIEDIFTTETRCVMLWTYRWTDAERGSGHIRGVDVYRIENGLICEKLSYVKG